MVTFYQVSSSCHDSSKNMAVKGWDLFSLYSYIKHFKNLFVRNHWIDFSITCQNCSFGDPLSWFSSSYHDAWKKNMAAGEQGYKIYTKILEQGTWLKLQQVCKAVCSGERYRTIMVLLFFCVCFFVLFLFCFVLFCFVFVFCFFVVVFFFFVFFFVFCNMKIPDISLL